MGNNSIDLDSKRTVIPITADEARQQWMALQSRKEIALKNAQKKQREYSNLSLEECGYRESDFSAEQKELLDTITSAGFIIKSNDSGAVTILSASSGQETPVPVAPQNTTATDNSSSSMIPLPNDTSKIAEGKESILKVAKDIESQAYDIISKYISDAKSSGSFKDLNGSVGDIYDLVEPLYTNSKGYNALSKDQKQAVRNDVNGYIRSKTEAFYGELSGEDSNGKEPFDTSSMNTKRLDKIADNISNYVEDSFNSMLERCVQMGKCPNQSQTSDFIVSAIDRGLTMYMGENYDLNEAEYVRNRLAVVKKKLLARYDAFSKTVTITNEYPSVDDAASVSGAPYDRPDGFSTYVKTNISFSGCDMVISADMKTSGGKTVSVTMGSVQTISYSIYRKLSPIYCIGNINAKDYVGGPRTIAGSIVFTVFNQHWGTELLNQFVAAEGYKESRKILMDEIAPINLTISMANEYGTCSRLAIYGVRFFSEGQVMSINDIFTENTYQYVAMNIDYLADINKNQEKTQQPKEADTGTEKTPSPLLPANEGTDSEAQTTENATENGTVSKKDDDVPHTVTDKVVNLSDYKSRNECITYVDSERAKLESSLYADFMADKVAEKDYLKAMDDVKEKYDKNLKIINNHYMVAERRS